MKLPEDVRLWVGGGAAACALVLGAGYLTVVAPHLSAAQTARGATAAAEQVNSTLTGQLTALGQQNRNLPAYVAALRAARTALPITADLSMLTAQLAGDAETSHVRLSSLSIGAVSPAVSGTGIGAAAGAATGSTAAAAGTSTGSTTTGSTATGSTSSGSESAAAATPAPIGAESTAAGATTTGATGTGGGVTGAAGPAGQVFQIQVTLITHGSLRQQLAFLRAVARPGTRAALVSSANLTPGGDPVAPGPAKGAAVPTTIDAASTLTTVVSVFVTPQTPAAAAALNHQLAAETAR